MNRTSKRVTELLVLVASAVCLMPVFASAQVLMRSPINSGVAINNYYDDDNTLNGQKTIYNCALTNGVTSPDDNHKGVDFPVSFNTPIVAAAAGKIYQFQNTCANTGSINDLCGDNIGLGNHYKIDHVGDNADGQGLASLYLHLNSSSVTIPSASSVSCGQQIGISAQSGQVTGPHLHFGLRANGSDPNVKIDPFDGPCSHPGTKYWNSLTVSNQPSSICQSISASPSNVAISNPTATTLTVNFADNATNESQLIVERKTGTSGVWGTRVVFSAQTGAQSWNWTDSGLTTGQTYCYRMRSFNGGGYSTYSNETCGAAQASTLPAAPSSVSISNALDSSLRVNFTDNATNETATLLERKIGTAGSWSQIASFAALGATGTWYWDNIGLSANTTYCYRLRAQNTSGYSAYSNEACGTTTGTSALPTAPSNVSVTNPTTNSLRVNFTDNATNETSIQIERRVNGGSWTSFGYFNALTGASSWNWDNTGLTSRIQYCYRLRAVNSAGNSAYSNEACGTTL